VKNKLLHEWHWLKDTLKRTDRQTAFVLTMAGFLVVLQFAFGSRRFFRTEIGGLLSDTTHLELMSWGWWFSIQGITGFVIPVLLLLLIFKKKPSEIGLGLGDWKLASILAGLYLPLVVIGTWILSDGESFQRQYPHYHQAAFDWTLFLIYELLFLFYWIGWEYLWRGFMIFGTSHTFGFQAVFIQAVPFAALHVDKPLPEALLSVVGGIALGALVWRCRSFWIAVPIHAAQMMILDFWCSLRLRTEIEGIGIDSLIEIFRQWLG